MCRQKTSQHYKCSVDTTRLLSGVKLGSGTRFNIRNPRISGADVRILRGGGAGQEFLGGGGVRVLKKAIPWEFSYRQAK